MPKIDTFVSDRNQYLDMIVAKLDRSMENFLTQKKLNYARSGIDAFQPKILKEDLIRKQEKTNLLMDRLIFSIKVTFNNYRKKLLELERLCNSLSYRKTLERGYVIVRDKNKQILENSKDAATAKRILLEFQDSDLSAETITKM